ncbi:MAG: LysM peptidoglycan-binding domain-containing protein [Planctomycetes bacterium]|nr:LysM peptidoglycan-binding domain-containing protein [Planctomycetota bacterium]
MISAANVARAALLSVFALAAVASTGCGGSHAAGAQSPPPPSLAAPVRVESSQASMAATVVPAEKAGSMDNREVGSSTPLPSIPSAAPAPAETVPVPSDAHGKTYVMQKGDTLYGVARKFNVPPKQLIAANNFSDPNKVNVGTKIRIP